MKLLKKLNLQLIDWRIAWNRFGNAERQRTYSDFNETGTDNTIVPQPLLYQLLFLGHCRHTVLLRSNAAAFFSCLLQKRVDPAQLRHGTVHPFEPSGYSYQLGICWIYENFFVEIGALPRFGYFCSHFFFVEDKQGDVDVLLMKNRKDNKIYRKWLQYNLSDENPNREMEFNSVRVEFYNPNEKQWLKIMEVGQPLSAFTIEKIIKMF